MKAKDVHAGGHYIAKVSGKLTVVRVDRIEEYNPSFSFNRLRSVRSQTRYHVTNELTGRKTVFRSAAKFRRVSSPEESRQWFAKRNCNISPFVASSSTGAA